MYVLMLNDMRSAKCEYIQPVLRAESRDEILALLKREEVDQYRDVSEEEPSQYE